MGENLANAGVFLVQTILGIYLIVLMLRFLMQLSRADFYNPICQVIVKLTDPVILPVKGVIPAVRGIDFATLLVAFLVQLLIFVLVFTLKGGAFFHPLYLALSFVSLFSTLLDIYFYGLLIVVIFSWVAPYSTHPAVSLIHQITEPICAPARKMLPPIGGMDFSIMLVLIFISLINTFLVVEPLLRFIMLQMR